MLRWRNVVRSRPTTRGSYNSPAIRGSLVAERVQRVEDHDEQPRAGVADRVLRLQVGARLGALELGHRLPGDDVLEGVDLLKDAVLVHLEVVLPEVEDRATVGRRVDVHAHEVGGRPELRRRLAGHWRRLLRRDGHSGAPRPCRLAFGQASATAATRRHPAAVRQAMAPSYPAIGTGPGAMAGRRWHSTGAAGPAAGQARRTPAWHPARCRLTDYI